MYKIWMETICQEPSIRSQNNERLDIFKTSFNYSLKNHVILAQY